MVGGAGQGCAGIAREVELSHSVFGKGVKTERSLAVVVSVRSTSPLLGDYAVIIEQEDLVKTRHHHPIRLKLIYCNSRHYLVFFSRQKYYN
eukprot:scaffold1362_cov219-Ochromonas_danica.AAC.2